MDGVTCFCYESGKERIDEENRTQQERFPASREIMV